MALQHQPEHEITVMTDTHGEVQGAAIFLTAEEVEELQETGSLRIMTAD